MSITFYTYESPTNVTTKISLLSLKMKSIFKKYSAQNKYMTKHTLYKMLYDKIHTI